MELHPTVHDLRVKTCFICHEDEVYTEPSNPPKAWVHPCTCTLVAHESCLLRWIFTSEENRTGRPRCSQCGTPYEMVSTKPKLLRAFEIMKWRLHGVGVGVTYLALGTIAASAASGIYILCTAYGTYAVRQFLGNDMFEAIIGEDPSNWPWNAWIFLPYVPVSLLVSRGLTRHPFGIPIIPLVAIWAGMRPGNVQDQPLRRLLQPDVMKAYDNAHWPISPFQLAILSPLIRGLYNHAFSRFAHYILKTRPRVRQLRRLAINALGLRLGIEIREEELAGQGRVEPRNDDDEDVDENEEAQVEAAEHIAESTTLSLIVGEALLLPTIASTMGKVLLRLSKHSSLLRRFLAVRPPLSPRGGLPKGWVPSVNPGELDWKNATLFAKLALRMWWKGTPLWLEADPVWWRNLVGWGVYTVTLDCIKLWFAWLKKSELETRHLQDRPFTNVDLSQLDLIEPERWGVHQ